MAESLAHTKWMCNYHIVFGPKYRRKIIYLSLREDIKEIIKDLCKWKGIKIIEVHMMLDRVHVLVSIPPKMIVSSFMGYLSIHKKSFTSLYPFSGTNPGIIT